MTPAGGVSLLIVLVTALVLCVAAWLRAERALSREKKRAAALAARLAELESHIVELQTLGSRLVTSVRGRSGVVLALFVAIAIAPWPWAHAQAARTSSCRPTVTVQPKPQPSNISSVDVYWDVSGSMRTLRTSTDLVVSTLDSSILQLAGAKTIRHYAVGNDLHPMRNAQDVGARSGWTALHKAALQIGQAFAAKRTGVAIIVSDLELEIPDSEVAQGGFACSGVPMPSASHAGAIFGRCLTAPLQPHAPFDALFVAAFERVTTVRRFFVLMVGTDVPLARSVHQTMQKRWQSEVTRSFVIADTTAITEKLGRPVTASWSAATARDVVRARSAPTGACAFLCTESDGAVSFRLAFDSSDQKTGWLTATRSGIVEERTKIVAASDNQSLTLLLRCPATRLKNGQTVGGRIDFAWLATAPSISTSRNVQDLFASLAAAIPLMVRPPSVTIHMSLR